MKKIWKALWELREYVEGEEAYHSRSKAAVSHSVTKYLEECSVGEREASGVCRAGLVAVVFHMKPKGKEEMSSE